MKSKIEAGRAVAARLFPAENAIDDAIVANASLQIALVLARKDTQQPCGTIQAAIEDAVASNVALSEARARIVSTHGRIVRLRDELGLPPVGYGCEAPCLPTFAELDGPQLKVA